jgi:hypothetical protein
MARWVLPTHWDQKAAGSRPAAARLDCGRAPATPASVCPRGVDSQSHPGLSANADGHRGAGTGTVRSSGGQPRAHRGYRGAERGSIPRPQLAGITTASGCGSERVSAL